MRNPFVDLLCSFLVSWVASPEIYTAHPWEVRWTSGSQSVLARNGHDEFWPSPGLLLSTWRFTAPILSPSSPAVPRARVLVPLLPYRAAHAQAQRKETWGQAPQHSSQIGHPHKEFCHLLGHTGWSRPYYDPKKFPHFNGECLNSKKCVCVHVHMRVSGLLIHGWLACAFVGWPSSWTAPPSFHFLEKHSLLLGSLFLSCFSFDLEEN